MKQSTGRKSSAWFWVGVSLLSISALWWLILIILVPEDIGGAVLTAVLTTALPIGIGIYGVRRGRKALAVETQRGPELAVEPVRETQMKQRPGQKGSAWFWVGVALLSISALWWLVSILANPGDIGAALLVGAVTTVIPIGVGIYGIVRGRKPEKYWAWTAVIFFAMMASIGGAISLVVILGTSLVSGLIILAIALSMAILVGWAEEQRKRLPGMALATVKSLEKLGAEFSMQVVELFNVTLETGASGIVVEGEVQQGSIQKGDDVQIIEKRHMRKAKVFDVVTLNGSGDHGKRIRLALEDVTEDDAK